jgi:hypothetical protein
MQVAHHFQICISYAIPHTTPAKEDGPRKADIHISTVLDYVCILRPDAENVDCVFSRLIGLVRLCLIRTYRTGLRMYPGCVATARFENDPWWTHNSSADN